MRMSGQDVSIRQRTGIMSLYRKVLRCSTLWLAFVVSSLIAAQERDILNPAPYLNQLKADREESWIQEQLRKFTSFRYLDRAYQLAQSGRLTEAKAEFERYLSRAPSDLEARANYLHLLYRLKDYGNVVRQADMILGQRPAYVPAQMHKGFAHQRLGLAADAIKDFRRAAETAGVAQADKILALDTAADLAMQLNRYSEALEFMRAIPAEGRNSAYWFREGLANERAGETMAAAESYRQAILSSQDPRFKVTVHRTLSDLAIREGKWSDAAKELKAASELLPGDEELSRSYQLARYEAATRSAEHEEALAAAESLAQDSGDAAGQMRVGMALERLGRSKEAAEAYARAEGFASSKWQKLRAWRAAAEAAKKAHDWPMVEQALLNAHKLEPGDYEILRGLAYAAYRQDNPADAVQWMEKAISAKPNLDDREFLANLCIVTGNYDRAIENLRRVLRGVRADSNRHRLYMSLGYACSGAGRKADASVAFVKAAALRKDPRTLIPLAQSLESDGRLDQATEYRRQLVEIQPSGENHYALGMLYVKVGRDDEALSHLETAVHVGLEGSKRLLALKQQASLYQKEKRFFAAKQVLLEAQGLDSRDASIPLMLAEIDAEAGDHASALRSVNQALSTRETARGFQLRAQVHQKLGNPAQALADYQRALSLLPADQAVAVPILVSLANIEFSAERFREAAAHYLEAFEKDPSGEADPLVQAAESLALAPDWAKAVEVNHRIIDLPQASRQVKAEAYRRLGIVYGRQERPQLAEESFRSALAMGDTDSRTLEELGMLLFESGRFAEARDSFGASVERRRSAEGLLRLARSYAAMGKSGIAIYYLQQALTTAGSLGQNDRDSVYRELGFLYAGTHEYAKASEAWSRSPTVAGTPEIGLRLARMQRLLENYQEARRILDEMDAHALPNALAGERLEEMALSAYGQGRDQETIRYMGQALAIESTPSRHFFLGLAYRRANNAGKALVHLQEAAAREPLNDEYALAFGYALHKAGRLKESIRALEPVAKRSPGYLNAVRDLGYFYLQDSDNRNAALWFRNAIDNGPFYSQRTEAEVLSVRQDLYRMRSEIRSINNRYDLTAYLAYRSDPAFGSASVLGGGVLPSQGGLEFSYQPAKVGFRAGRVLQLTGRLLWNTEPGSLRFDSDSYQAGLGVRYKPIPKHNLFVSGERIFRIGDATSSGWLWRGMYSWARGRDLMPGSRVRNYSLFFGDAGYFTPEGGTMAFYSEIHQGVAFRVGSGALLKPHVIVDGRYQNRDVPRGSYVEAGGGVSFQLFFSETKYEIHRVGLEFLFHYKRAWLQPNPELQGDRIFDGWTITSLIIF